jgi:hypothetical protein
MGLLSVLVHRWDSTVQQRCSEEYRLQTSRIYQGKWRLNTLVSPWVDWLLWKPHKRQWGTKQRRKTSWKAFLRSWCGRQLYACYFYKQCKAKYRSLHACPVFVESHCGSIAIHAEPFQVVGFSCWDFLDMIMWVYTRPTWLLQVHPCDNYVLLGC